MARAEDATATQAEVVDAETVLGQARELVNTAQFGAAERALSELLARSQLTAQQRNDALELTAILHIAQRDEAKAQQALALLLSRDPRHRRRVLDVGPAIDAAFARAEQHQPIPVDANMAVALARDEKQRLTLSVELSSGESAVDSVHLHISADALGDAHLVSTTGNRTRVAFPLSLVADDAKLLRLYVEAQAPSGFVLGRAGQAASPLQLAVPPAPTNGCAVVEKPLRKQWWVWTTVGLVLSGITVASAISAN